MRGYSSNHDQECSIAAREILNQWKQGKWLNNFIDRDVALNRTSHMFPSPDQCFYSENTQSGIAMEFKPAIRETKRGILTGLGQSIAYLKDENNSASMLVIPEVIGDEDFPIAEFIKEIFEQQIFNKIPIALYCFKKNNPSKVQMLCNIGNELKPTFFLDSKKTQNTYWAAWRDVYPSFVYSLLRTAKDEQSKGKSRIAKIWKDFYFNYYCYHKNTVETLELIHSELTRWNPKEKIVWRESRKKALTKLLDNNDISFKEAIALLKWDAASSLEERNKYWNIIKKLAVGPKHNTDNDFMGQKKNKRNFLSHIGLWTNEDWQVTELGDKFLKRVENGNNSLEELAAILMVSGRFNELVEDIKLFQARIDSSEISKTQNLLKQIFLDKGYIGSNIARKSTGNRNFLQSEQQIMGRIGILEMNGTKYRHSNIGYKFNDKRIGKLVKNYYKNYGSI